MKAKLTYVSVIAICVAGLGQSHAQEPAQAVVGRFIILPANYVNRNGVEVPIVIKLDTVTGESWRLVEPAPDPKTGEFLTYWAPLPVSSAVVAFAGANEKGKPTEAERAQRAKEAAETALKFLEKSK